MKDQEMKSASDTKDEGVSSTSRFQQLTSNRVYWLAFYLSLASAIIAVPILVTGSRYVISDLPQYAPIALILGTLATACFGGIKYPPQAPYLRITLVGCSVLIALNIAWLGFDFPVVHEPVYSGVSPLFPILPLLALITGVAAIFRPAFAIIIALIFAMQKELVVSMAGGLPGFSHYLVIVDTMVFVAVAIVAIVIARMSAEYLLGTEKSAELRREDRLDFYFLTAMCIAIGVHFGNYFLSGIGKALLDGGLISWILENKTQYTMLAGYNLGSAPLSFYNPLFGFAFESMDRGYVLLNILVLLSQTFCFIAFFRKKLMIAWVLFFDIMHVTIFVLTGALFIHWIALNFLLVLSVSKMPANLAPRPALIAGVVATLIGHFAFNTMQMAWYDNRQIRDAGFVAIYEDGTEARVPPSYFRESAYGFYNRWFRLPPGTAEGAEAPNGSMASADWPAQTAAWGQVDKIALMRQGEACQLPERPSSANRIDFDLEAVKAYIKARHSWAIDRIENGKPLRYHLFPHDHFSMPWRFKNFDQSDVNDIVSYYYRVETICLSWQNGELNREVLTQATTEPISVAGVRHGEN